MLSGIIFDIKHFAIYDGPGIRTTVFMKGCPLRCAWCHNPESQEEAPLQWTRTQMLDGECYQDNEWVGRNMDEEEVMAELKKDKPFHKESGGGVTFSGGEPLMQADFLVELLQSCRKEGMHTCVDTSGHANPVVIRKVMELTDLFLYDLKIMDDAKHVEYTGISNELTISNLNLLASENANLLIRMPVIPGITDEEPNLAAIAELMISLEVNKIELLPFHPIAEHKYRKMGASYRMAGLEAPDYDRMEQVRTFFANAGINALLNE